MTMPFNWSSHGSKTKTEHYYSAHNIATSVSFDMEASVHDSNHYDVDRIFVGLSWELHHRWQLDRVLEVIYIIYIN